MASGPRAPLQRISHNTLQEQVYRNIRQSLSDGQFKPGEVLTIRDLARQLGTSVMPVREALHKLIVGDIRATNERYQKQVARLQQRSGTVGSPPRRQPEVLTESRERRPDPPAARGSDSC